jgi:hypothetical protein
MVGISTEFGAALVRIILEKSCEQNPMQKAAWRLQQLQVE